VIAAVSGGDWHSSALASDGTVWKWGRNDVGQFGNGTSDGAGNYFPHPIPAEIQRGCILATPPINTLTVPATNARSFYRLKF
jgi:alpha-tubulin suppressor-like RCC1 family protein